MQRSPHERPPAHYPLTNRDIDSLRKSLQSTELSSSASAARCYMVSGNETQQAFRFRGGTNLWKCLHGSLLCTSSSKTSAILTWQVLGYHDLRSYFPTIKVAFPDGRLVLLAPLPVNQICLTRLWIVTKSHSSIRHHAPHKRND